MVLFFGNYYDSVLSFMCGALTKRPPFPVYHISRGSATLPCGGNAAQAAVSVCGERGRAVGGFVFPSQMAVEISILHTLKIDLLLDSKSARHTPSHLVGGFPTALSALPFPFMGGVTYLSEVMGLFCAAVESSDGYTLGKKSIGPLAFLPLD